MLQNPALRKQNNKITTGLERDITIALQLALIALLFRSRVNFEITINNKKNSDCSGLYQ